MCKEEALSISLSLPTESIWYTVSIQHMFVEDTKLQIHISSLNTTLYFSVSSNPSILVAYWNITIIQDPSSFFKKNFIYTPSFYFSSIWNLKEVSTLHILGKSIRYNNILGRKNFKLFIYLKILPYLVTFMNLKKYTQWMIFITY